MRDRFDSVEHLREFRRPALVLVGGLDTIIPPAHARLLYAGLSGPKKLIELPASGHNDWMNAMTASDWQALVGFFENALPPVR